MIGPKQVTGVDVPDLPGNLSDPDGLPDLSAKLLLCPHLYFILMEDIAL
jgi:hypothetical protein